LGNPELVSSLTCELGLSEGLELGTSVLLMTVTVSTPLVERPDASVAVTVTVVSPIGNDDPLAWLSATLGLASQSSSAVAEKVTTASESPTLLAVKTRFHGSVLPLTFGMGGVMSEDVNQPVGAGYKLPLHPSIRTTVLPARRVYCTGLSHTER
jgi:hypothetical protein